MKHHPADERAAALYATMRPQTRAAAAAAHHLIITTNVSVEQATKACQTSVGSLVTWQRAMGFRPMELAYRRPRPKGRYGTDERMGVALADTGSTGRTDGTTPPAPQPVQMEIPDGQDHLEQITTLANALLGVLEAIQSMADTHRELILRSLPDRRPN